MLLRDQAVSGVQQLLEELYLESASERTRREYANLSENEKQMALLDFAKKQATSSKRWAAIVQDLRSLGLTEGM